MTEVKGSVEIFTGEYWTSRELTDYFEFAELGPLDSYTHGLIESTPVRWITDSPFVSIRRVEGAVLFA